MTLQGSETNAVNRLSDFDSDDDAQEARATGMDDTAAVYRVHL